MQGNPTLTFRGRYFFCVLFLCCLWPGTPFGFSEESEFVEKTVKRETAEERKVADTAVLAKDKEALEALGRVTYEDILSRPDDIQLNFRYAKEQVRAGNLLGAASSLERILILRPDLHAVRLFYAAVLFRLDNLTESARALDMLAAVDLPPEMKADVKIYRDRIKKRQKRTRLILRQSVGYQIDTNRNAAPSSKTRVIGNTASGIPPADRKRRDTAFLNVTSVDAVHDLGHQAGHEVFGSFSYYLQEQTIVDDLDLSSFAYRFGGTFKSKWLNLTPVFSANHLFLDRETFLRSQGGRIQADRNFGRLDVFASTGIERQDYRDIHTNRVSHEQKGRKFDLSAGFNYALLPTLRFSSGIACIDKNAEEDYNSYQALELNQSLTWLLGKGQFLAASLGTGFDRYAEVEDAVAARHRRDKTLRMRVTYGAPLTTLWVGKILPGPFKDITLSVTYEYFRELSNITNYSYTNNKFQSFLTKRWEF